MASQEQLDGLLEEMHTHVPDLKIIYKSDEGWYKEHFFLRVIHLYAVFVGLFSKSLRERFETRIAHGVRNFIVLPTRERYGDLKQNHAFEILWHEYTHLRQYWENPLLWLISYFLVLPTVFTFRARFEKPAYAASMLARFNTTGSITEPMKAHIASMFTSSLYLWMWPFKKKARKWVDKTAEAIESGELNQYYIKTSDV